MSRTKRGRKPADRSPKTLESVIPYFISVYCADGHDKFRIGTLYPDVIQDEVHWLVHPSKYFEPGSDVGTPIACHIVQHLVGDEWMPADDNDAIYDAGFRMRWLLRCDDCRRRRAIRKPSDLFDQLSMVVRQGGSEIEISHFAFAQHADCATVLANVGAILREHGVRAAAH